MKKLKQNFSGVTAEYLVAAELSKRGFIASMTIKNMPGIDIVVTDKTASKVFGIQVKAKQDLAQKKSWTLGKNDETRVSDNLFYVFVDLAVKKNRESGFYIFPSREVAQRIKKYHIKWLKNPKHNDNNIRTFILNDGEEPHNWHILGI
ncbi:MAG: hypothetical protein FWD13_11170 [Treponema sp.]|nr:hypothetical protein [Treponema sp.]